MTIPQSLTDKWKNIAYDFSGAFLLLKGSYLGHEQSIDIVPISTEWKEMGDNLDNNTIDCSTSIDHLIDTECLQSMTYPIRVLHHYGWMLANITEVVKCQIFNRTDQLSIGVALTASLTSFSESDWYSSESENEGPIIIFVFDK